MSDEKHALLEIERARVAALLRHDVAALDRMMAEECVRTGGQMRPEQTARHLRVYVRRDGRWLLVVHQATESHQESPVAQRVE